MNQQEQEQRYAEDIAAIAECSGTNNNNYRHGHAFKGNLTPTYKAWRSMKHRCTVKTSKGYKNYGGAGITICDRWISSYANFLADMGEKPEGMSLDRINNDDGYHPGNCRWATHYQQCRNKRTNHMITYNGETMCLGDWEVKLGIRRGTLKDRINRYKMPIEKAMTKGDLRGKSNGA